MRSEAERWYRKNWDPDRPVGDWFELLANSGWGYPGWPTDWFGRGLDRVDVRTVREERRKIGALPPPSGIGPSLLAPMLFRHGTDNQMRKFLPAMAWKGETFCQMLSEPEAGSDLAGVTTKAILDGDEWVVNGSKIWTSYANVSDWIFCLVRTDPQAPKHKGISYLLIPMDSPGIEIRPLVDMTLDAGFNEVFFTDVRIPAGNIVGEIGQGWLEANKTLVHERGSLGDPTAIVSRMNQLIELMKTETLDGTRIIDKPVFRDRVMKIQGRVLAVQNHGLRLLSARLNNRKDAMFGIMILKLIGTELRHELEGLAIDVMGELGTLYQDSPNLRDNGSWQFAYMMYLGLIIGGGTNQIQKNIIAERGLGLPKAPKIKEA